MEFTRASISLWIKKYFFVKVSLYFLRYLYNFIFICVSHFNASGEQWFHDRKLIGPTFHFSVLDQFAMIVFEKAEILTKCLQKEIEKDPGKAVNIFPFIINVALDIICGKLSYF